MKKLMVLATLVLLCSLGPAWSAEEIAKAPASADSAHSAAVASDVEFIKELRGEMKTQPMGGPPPCPAQEDCGGGHLVCGESGSYCGATLQPYDLGVQSCSGNGQMLHCPHGQTVHVDAGICQKCPCCTSQPNSCLCPDCTGPRAVGPVYCQ